MIGAGVFVVSQGLIRAPLLYFLQQNAAFQSYAQSTPSFLYMYFIFLAGSAALVEEGGRWLALRYIVRPADRTYPEALQMGLGHGGIEALGVGLTQLVGLGLYLPLVYAPDLFNTQLGASAPEAQAQYEAMQGWEPFIGMWERFMAIALHVTFTVLVVRSFHDGIRWLWIALGAHFLLDLVAVTTSLFQPAVGTITALLITLSIITVFGISGILFLRNEWRKYKWRTDHESGNV